MAYVNYNPNPARNLVGDCVVRALSYVLNMDWERVYMELAVQGFLMHDMPTSNNVWGTYLSSKGFKRYIIPNTCPDCYTVADFCNDNPQLIGVLATGTHLVAVDKGYYYDTWDSGNEPIIYYWEKEE